MTNDRTLPPLPASDEKAISSNGFDPFYRVRARDFWGQNEIHRERPKPFEKCKHYFVPKPGAAECEKCGFGLMGYFEVQKGKLYYKGKEVGL